MFLHYFHFYLCLFSEYLVLIQLLALLCKLFLHFPSKEILAVSLKALDALFNQCYALKGYFLEHPRSFVHKILKSFIQFEHAEQVFLQLCCFGFPGFLTKEITLLFEFLYTPVEQRLHLVNENLPLLDSVVDWL